MQCIAPEQVASNNPLTFNCSGNDIGAILTDNGTGAASSGSFFMQPGIYHVEFYALAFGCGRMNATIDNVSVARLFNSGITQCPTGTGGIMASAQIMQFGPNQILRFLAPPTVT